MQATWGAILFCEMYRGDPNDLLNQLLCNKYDGFIVNVLKNSFKFSLNIFLYLKNYIKDPNFVFYFLKNIMQL